MGGEILITLFFPVERNFSGRGKLARDCDGRRVWRSGKILLRINTALMAPALGNILPQVNTRHSKYPLSGVLI
jgi:hypothetical protein